MNIGVRYGRRTAAATLALIGLLIVTGPMHLGNPLIPSAAYADTIRSVANVCDWTKVPAGINFLTPKSRLFKLSGGPRSLGV